MDVPILPVAHNAGWLWPKGVIGKRPGTVTLSIGKPIAPAGDDGGRAHAGRRDVDREAKSQRLGSPLARCAAIRDEARPVAQRDRETPAEAACARIVLAGAAIDYRLIRARRRSIGMEVHLDGLTVRAPRWVTLRDIELALAERAALDRSLARRMADAAARRHAARMEVRRADPLPRRRSWRSRSTASQRTSIAADLFHLTVRHPRAHDECRGRRKRRPIG